jgi:hypothetical protein
MSYEEEDTCMSNEEEDTCKSYEEEDTCKSYEEEDTCSDARCHANATPGQGECLPFLDKPLSLPRFPGAAAWLHPGRAGPLRALALRRSLVRQSGCGRETSAASLSSSRYGAP